MILGFRVYGVGVRATRSKSTSGGLSPIDNFNRSRPLSTGCEAFNDPGLLPLNAGVELRG
jgi:hypothetical protein